MDLAQPVAASEDFSLNRRRTRLDETQLVKGAALHVAFALQGLQ
jgi:hypothetical protein